MPYNFTTPEGRIVGGDPYKTFAVTDDKNKPKLNPDGTPIMQQYIKLALPKNDPEVIAWKAACDADARAAWPQFFDPAGNCTNPAFSTKIVDGDGKNRKGVSYATREGYPGCWVVTFARTSSAIGPVPVDKHNGAAWAETQPGAVKTGDYVKVLGETKSNQSTQTEGMYMNMARVAFWREGKAIIVGPDADTAWGAAAPPGTVATGGAPLGTPGQPVTPPPAAPATPAAGHHMGVPELGAPAVPLPPSVPSAVPAPQMTPKANGMARETFLAQGWTDDLLIQHGYMIA